MAILKNKQILQTDEVLSGRFIPVHCTALLIEYLTEQHNIPLPVLLKEGELTIQELLQPSSRIPAYKFINIIRFALQTSKESSLGLMFGKSLGPNSFHIMGHAAIAQTSLRESIQLLTRYYKTTAFLTEIALQEHDNKASFKITPLVFLGAEESFIIDAVMSGFITELSKFGFSTSAVSMLLAKPTPDYDEAYLSLACKNVKFNCLHNAVQFPKSWLDKPLISDYNLGDDHALIDICDQNLERAEQAISCVERIKDSLRQAVGQMPNLDDVAASYHQSTRSLQRVLKIEGQSFRQLIEEIRKERSQQLLLNTNMNIVDIATQLGYSEPPNFTRAFKHWFGCSPQHYRQQHDCQQHDCQQQD